MLTSVSVRNFQSLRSADLTLGRFTVVIGPSNSGKSALLRAIRMVAANVTSPKDVVAHGATAASVEIDVDGVAVGVIRGKSRSEYVLGDETYTKAGTSVPEPIAKLLRFGEIEGEDLNFAFQFDRPFLLDVPTTTAAKVLGDLTNVNRIYSAVREANRRRLVVGSTVKVLTEDVERLTDEAQKYVNVPTQRKAVVRARELYDEARGTQERLDRLNAFTRVVEASEVLLGELKNFPYPDVPIVEIEERVEQHDRLRSLITVVERAAEFRGSAAADLERIEQALATVEKEYHDMLKEAGSCPMCGQTIR